MELELEELERRLRSAKERASADDLINYLRLARELRVRDSVSTAKYGSLLLRNHRSMLPEEELWTVYEQVAIAALDANAMPLAVSLIKVLQKRFPGSMRMQRLQAMYFECRGDEAKAKELYNNILEEEPTNDMALKRLVALARSGGRTADAIEALKTYLDNYPNDADAWEEQAELYLEVYNYRQAAFCYEELLMLNPGNSSYHVRYADTLYTLGGASNYKTAKAYYAKALDLTAGGSLRALYGLAACAASLPEKVAVQDARSRAAIELPGLTAQALLRIYQEHAKDKLPLVQELLTKQGLLEVTTKK